MLDAIRIVTLTATALAGMLLPGTITRRIGGWRAAVVATVFLLLLASDAAAVATHFGEPLAWYRTPPLLAASVLALIYVVSAWRQPAHLKP